MYLFCFYVESRYGYLYRTAEPWFDTEVVANNCPGAVFHFSETHPIHKIGNHLKNFGLRACMVIEAEQESDAVLLRMLEDQIIRPGVGKRPPVLQLVLKDPDWEALGKLCEPLDAHRATEYQRRGEHKATMTLQRQIDRMSDTVDDLQDLLSDGYTRQTDDFIMMSYDEIERIKEASKAASKKAAFARRALLKKLISYSIFTLTPNLK